MFEMIELRQFSYFLYLARNLAYGGEEPGKHQSGRNPANSELIILKQNFKDLPKIGKQYNY